MQVSYSEILKNGESLGIIAFVRVSKKLSYYIFIIEKIEIKFQPRAPILRMRLFFCLGILCRV